ncbi:MAG: hypothetical protein N3G22_04945 [Candidatus Micrarchaeota archaeon]|nr:hypothetical protein [Candidatus Micrarchaeota archaeon]
MVSLKKIVPCKCGANNSFSFESDMSVEEISVSARCSMCGAAMHVSVSSFLSPAPQPSPASSPSPTQQELDAETKANVEQAVRDLFRY